MRCATRSKANDWLVTNTWRLPALSAASLRGPQWPRGRSRRRRGRARRPQRGRAPGPGETSGNGRRSRSRGPSFTRPSARSRGIASTRVGASVIQARPAPSSRSPTGRRGKRTARRSAFAQARVDTVGCADWRSLGQDVADEPPDARLAASTTQCGPGVGGAPTRVVELKAPPRAQAIEPPVGRGSCTSTRTALVKPAAVLAAAAASARRPGAARGLRDGVGGQRKSVRPDEASSRPGERIVARSRCAGEPAGKAGGALEVCLSPRSVSLKAPGTPIRKASRAGVSLRANLTSSLRLVRSSSVAWPATNPTKSRADVELVVERVPPGRLHEVGEARRSDKIGSDRGPHEARSRSRSPCRANDQASSQLVCGTFLLGLDRGGHADRAVRARAAGHASTAAGADVVLGTEAAAARVECRGDALAIHFGRTRHKRHSK